MKAAFKIVPELTAGKEYHLLAEAGRDGISLAWYSKDPLTIEGLFIYHSPKNISDTTLAEELQKLFAAEQLPHYHSCRICYNFKESLLVPDEYDQVAHRAQLLDCIYGEMPGSKYFSEAVKGMNATNIYRVPDGVDDALNNRFFSAEAVHSNSWLLPCIQQRDLYCIVYNNYIKAVLFMDGKLQLIQFYDYNTPSDVAYHLLNICTQHELSPSAITLTLSGFIDRQSNLYEELYRYFLHISLDEVPGDIVLADAIRVYPDHFFSFLIPLVQCAS